LCVRWKEKKVSGRAEGNEGEGKKSAAAAKNEAKVVMNEMEVTVIMACIAPRS
jgi:hypothetical protein